MKKKKHYLSARVKTALLALFGFAFFLTLVVIYVSVRNPDALSRAVPLLVAPVFGALAAGVTLLVTVPYKHLCHIQRMFVSGQLYEELLQQRVELSPEYESVIGYFDNVINKHDVADLSHRQAEHLALQNQINPHFLYNTLEANRGDALGIGATDIAQTTEALSTFFRYTIAETGNLVPIDREIENIENYFIIQQYRFGDKLKMDIIIDDDRKTRRYLIPKLTLQPIIENAIFHGLENKVGGGMISVRMQATERRVLISISDNGVGMSMEDVDAINRRLDKVALNYISDEKKHRGSGIALRNVAQRIKLLFGEEYGLSLYSIQGMGTKVRINIPKCYPGVEGGAAAK